MGRNSERAPASHEPSPISSSFRAHSPLAERALARDIAACSDDEDANTAVDDTHAAAGEHDAPVSDHTMYRRPSGVAYGGSRPVFSPQESSDDPPMTPLERKQSRNAERSLLRDNHVLPSKHPEWKPSLAKRVYRQLFGTKVGEQGPPILVQPPSETSPLLAGGSSSRTSESDLEEQWEQAVASGRIRTTWQRETKTLVEYSAPLIITFFLQYSINVASIFAVGHIGKIELGAVSLANMTAAITCIAPFQGLATSLDTLCAQAYGSGHKHLVGLQVQRMTCFLLILTLPIAVLWYFAEDVLRLLVPEAESARLAGLYLRVMIFSIPGLVLFECGKRFTQAQGLFRATTYVLIVVAPFNAFILWLMVWHLEMGYIGAPIAVAITYTLLPILLFLYVRFVDGSQCWGGFSRRALSNWWPMIRLALPGMVMVEAEWLAFEIMTILASRFGSDDLAAQSVLITLSSISYQIPFSMSIASSTRIANMIGAGLVDAAKTTGKVAFYLACIMGVFNVTIFSTLRFQLPVLFTDDEEVISIVAAVLPFVAVLQVFDGLSASAHGLLRGIGKQSIGGPANLFSHYVIALPISIGLGFGLNWKLEGLWIGGTVGLCVASIIEYGYLLWTDWEVAAREAAARNESG